MKLFAIYIMNNATAYGGVQPLRQAVLFVFVPFDKNTLGDIVAIRDDGGEVVAEYYYDAWGNLNDCWGEMASVNPFRYRGYYYDNETGFYYLQTRYYDPSIMRFVNADNYELVSQLAGSHELNLYAYCGNNPINGYDPYGTIDWASIGKIALGVLVVAGLAVVSVATAGTASVVLAGAAIGAGAGFVSGGVSGVVSGGGLSGFANGALTGSITGAISGAVATSPLNLGAQIGINTMLNVGNYAIGQTISGGKIEAGGLLLSVLSGVALGAIGGSGWLSGSMSGQVLKADIALNMSRNFLRHSATYLGKDFLIKFYSANVLSGIISGGYGLLGN